MTKEDVSEDVKGGCVPGWLSAPQWPVIHQVASAPMPSDCGERPHTYTPRTLLEHKESTRTQPSVPLCSDSKDVSPGSLI